nr:ubiquitin carboxyl terminal hydrolase 20 [Hymenolepis microstoma]
MNSALQIVLNISPFTRLFYARAQTLSQQSQVPLSKAYLQLLIDMGHLDDQVGVSIRRKDATPGRVLDVMRITHPIFRGLYQQDSQEFLRAFLGDLHEELKLKPFNESKYPSSAPAVNAVKSEDGSGDVNHNDKRPGKNKRGRNRKSKELNLESSKKEAIKPLPLSSSAVKDVFQGCTVTCVKCLSCEKVFHRNEVFLDLSLPISSPHSKPKITEPTGTSHAKFPSNSTSPRLSSAIINTNSTSSNSFSNNSKRVFKQSIDTSVGLFYWASLYLIWMLSWLKSVPPISYLTYYLVSALMWLKRSAITWDYSLSGVDKNLVWDKNIELEDCLDTFFDVSELSGENKYSCVNCSKYTNGQMHLEITKLPEILCLHLKRFRHDFNTSKIYTRVNFPLYGLSLKKYLHTSCKDKVWEYDLSGVVCHTGTVRFGHYFTYALNNGDGEWYEFNDSEVSRVDADTISSLTSEAYLLVYRKRQDYIQPIRDHFSIKESQQIAYISIHWLLRFSEFADPGPITNSDFLCNHGALQPLLAADWDKYFTVIPYEMWNYLFSHFGGGPYVDDLHPCDVCQEKLDLLEARRKQEFEAFNESPADSEYMYVISREWFKSWANFVCGHEVEPPGPINNSRILESLGPLPGTYKIRMAEASDKIDWVSQSRWNFLFSTYGGGPEHAVRNCAFVEKNVSDEAEAIEKTDKLEFMDVENGNKLKSGSVEETDNEKMELFENGTEKTDLVMPSSLELTIDEKECNKSPNENGITLSSHLEVHALNENGNSSTDPNCPILSPLLDCCSSPNGTGSVSAMSFQTEGSKKIEPYGVPSPNSYQTNSVTPSPSTFGDVKNGSNGTLEKGCVALEQVQKEIHGPSLNGKMNGGEGELEPMDEEITPQHHPLSINGAASVKNGRLDL